MVKWSRSLLFTFEARGSKSNRQQWIFDKKQFVRWLTREIKSGKVIFGIVSLDDKTVLGTRT